MFSDTAVPNAAPDRHAAAVDVARAWMRGRLPSGLFDASVTHVIKEPTQAILVRWTGRTRRVVLRTTPTTSRSRVLEPPPVLDDLDPWDSDRQLAALSVPRLCTCPDCLGSKSTTCPRCTGLASRTCEACDGSGRVYSRHTHRTVACRRCGGDGRTSCPCRDGQVRCVACQGRGRVSAWVELEERTFEDAREAGNTAIKPHSAPGQARDVRHVLAWRGSSTDASPEQVWALFQQHPSLLRPIDARADRLTEIDVSVWESSLVQVGFRLFGRDGTVCVRAWDATVDHRRTDTGPLGRRFLLMLGAGLLGLGVALALALWYSTRGAFYAESWIATLLALGILALPAALLWSTRRLGAPQSPWRARQRLAALCRLLAITAVWLGVIAAGEPSIGHARALIQGDRCDAALRELHALAARDGQGSDAARLHDATLVEKASKDAAKLVGWAHVRRDQFLDVRTVAQVDTLYFEAFERRVRELVVLGQASRAVKVTSEIPWRLGNDPRRSKLVRTANAGAAAERWEIVVSTHAPLAARIAACAATRQYADVAGTFETLAGRAEHDSASMEVSAAFVISTCNQLAALQRRDAERDAARREQQQRRERAAAAAAERSWALAPLLCRDGTLSPSCRCGRGSYRGCCSHHLGVAGCSATR